ncbi:MAG: hypothetical protein OWT27_10880, partial [Firmicutes bacterium]|nr:hypothetical protein [Bacillota bacterium]
CPVYWVSQRPKRIPLTAVSMTEHLFLGNVQGADLKALEQLTGREWGPVLEARAKQPYSFVYWSRLTRDEPVLITT